MSQTNQACQASVVPYRFVKSKIQFCLITSRSSQRWGFPKGWIHDHETIEHAGLTEANEEAGLVGEIVGKPLGSYNYKKAGRKRDVVVMLMRVDEYKKRWKESHERDRCWVSPGDAQELLLERPDLAEMISLAMRVLQPEEDIADGAA